MIISRLSFSPLPTSPQPNPPSPFQLHVLSFSLYTHSPLSLLSSAHMCMGVGLSTKAWQHGRGHATEENTSPSVSSHQLPKALSSKQFFSKIFFTFISVSVYVYGHMCAGAYRGRNWRLNSLELKIEMVVSHMI